MQAASPSTQERAMANVSNVQPYNCPSLWPLDMPQLHLILWAVVASILSPVIILANSTLIYGLFKTQQLTTITNKFILIMSISDLCTGIFVLPLIVVKVCLKDSIQSCNFELFVQSIGCLFAQFSFFMLMCISTDRYIHVTKLNKYNQFMNTRRMKIATALSFILSLLIAYLPISFPSFWLHLTLCLSNLVCVSLMLYLYSLVFRKLAIYTENFKRMFEKLRTCESASREAKRELSATTTIRFVLGALLVLYLPYNISSVAWIYYKYERKSNPPLLLNVIFSWSIKIVVSNAAINSIIICHGNGVVRRFIFTRFHRVGNQVV